MMDFGYNYISSSSERVLTIIYNKNNYLFDRKYKGYFDSTNYKSCEL